MLGNLHAKTACWGVSCRTTLPCEFPFAPHNEEVFIQRVHSVKHQYAQRACSDIFFCEFRIDIFDFAVRQFLSPKLHRQNPYRI